MSANLTLNNDTDWKDMRPIEGDWRNHPQSPFTYEEIEAMIKPDEIIQSLKDHAEGKTRLSLERVYVAFIMLNYVTKRHIPFDGIPLESHGTRGVYLIEAEGTGRHKIGWAEDVWKRLKTLQTGCPYPLKVVNVMAGERIHESWLHKLFKRYRVQGEWFELPDNMYRFTASLE